MEGFHIDSPSDDIEPSVLLDVLEDVLLHCPSDLLYVEGVDVALATWATASQSQSPILHTFSPLMGALL